MTTPAKKTRSKRSEYLPDENEARALSGDFVAPHSIEAEQRVLGCVLLNAEVAMSECEEAGLSAEWFHHLPHRILWEALGALYNDGAVVDPMTLFQKLKEQGTLLEVGGLEYFAGFPDQIGNSGAIGHWLGIVREKWTRRRMMRIARGMLNGAADESTDLEEGIALSQREVQALSESASGQAEVHIKSLVLECIDQFQNHYVRGYPQIDGYTTGLSYFDKVSGGVGGENGKYPVIAARPGAGKTSLEFQLVRQIAMKHQWYSPVALDAMREKFGGELIAAAIKGEAELPEGFLLAKDHSTGFERHFGVPCVFSSMEMTGRQLTGRGLFQEAEADLQRFRTGFARQEDFDKLFKAAHRLGNAPIWIDETAQLDIDTFKARVRRLKRQYGIKLFALDYIQLMKIRRERGARIDRVAELEEISGQIRALGKDEQVTIIVAAQLNRDVTKGDRWREPQASDIKNCGAIEQDADQIMLLYKPKMDADTEELWLDQVKAVQGEEDWSHRLYRVNCLFDKNRYGISGKKIELVFDGACTLFHDYGDWQKRHGIKELAAGESPKSVGVPDDSDGHFEQSEMPDS